tara:strand:- start:584 stop:1300 length:717 start_codon:yes stop_codon:yes gene_type:complete
MENIEKIFNNFFLGLDLNKIRTSIKKNGFSTLGEIQSNDYCDSVRKIIDSLSDNDGVEHNFDESEHRIWKAHEKSDLINYFFDFSNQVISSTIEKQSIANDILAIRNFQLPNKSSSNINGRWHMDSFNHQLKIFLFLKDVNLSNGPLEIIPGTQRLNFKLKSLCKGYVFSLSNFLSSNGEREYQKINDNYIEFLIENGFKVNSFTITKGTVVIVDTSALHRAKPCIGGSRYALTSYYE